MGLHAVHDPWEDHMNWLLTESKFWGHHLFYPFLQQQGYWKLIHGYQTIQLNLCVIWDTISLTLCLVHDQNLQAVQQSETNISSWWWSNIISQWNAKRWDSDASSPCHSDNGMICEEDCRSPTSQEQRSILLLVASCYACDILPPQTTGGKL